MIKTFAKQLWSTVLSTLLVITGAPFEAGAQQPAPSGTPGYPVNLRHCRPISCSSWWPPSHSIPTRLVAQVLGAATFPDQVTAADNFLQQNAGLRDSSSCSL